MEQSSVANIFKQVLLVALLLLFFIVGILYVFFPERFMRGKPWLEGGDLRRESNSLGLQIAGLLLAAFAAYGLWEVFLRQHFRARW